MKTTITILFISCTLFASAQTPSKSNNPRLLKRQQLYKNIQQLSRNSTSNKTRAQDDRLIAEAYEEAQPIDSMTYSYSGARGSHLDTEYLIEFDDIQYDQLNYYEFGSTPLLQSKTYCTYNGNNQLLTQIDSTYVGTTYVPSFKVTNTYNTNNELLESLTETWNGTAWANAQKTLNTFTGGQLTANLSLMWNGTSWDSSSRTENVYMGNNLVESTDYSYMSGWVGTEKRIRTYNGNNQVLTEEYQVYQSPNWINNRKDTFQYNASNQLIVLLYYMWNNNQWENGYNSLITWTGNRITQVIPQEWNGTSWDNTERYTYTYNSNDYPITETADYWNGTAFVYDPSNDSYKIRYYYESYNNNVGVNDITEEVFGAINIFPNPAQDVITVNFENKTNSKKEAVLLDMTGSIISKTAISNVENSVRIPLTHMAKGNYLLQLRDENGSVLSKKVTKN